jgi:hypothetical protein
MSDAPGTIYLQYDPDGETTWCEDKINDDDIVYVLAADLEQVRADRDSESRWAKEYLARADRAEQDAERLAEVIRHGLRVGALSGRRIGRYALDALDKHHAVEPDPAHDAAKDGAK